MPSYHIFAEFDQKIKSRAADVMLTQIYQHQSMYLCGFFGYINVALLSYADKCFVVEFATLMQLLATFNT